MGRGDFSRGRFWEIVVVVGMVSVGVSGSVVAVVGLVLVERGSLGGGEAIDVVEVSLRGLVSSVPVSLSSMMSNIVPAIIESCFQSSIRSLVQF